MKESDLMRDIQIAASIKGWRLLRNNTGCVKASNGKRIRFGLHVGSSDLIGWRTVNRVAQFVAVEVKTAKGITTKAQQQFLQAVIRAGGIGIIARSVEDLEGI